MRYNHYDTIILISDYKMSNKDSAAELAAKLDMELDDFIKDKIANPSGPAMNDDFLDMDAETLANVSYPK